MARITAGDYSIEIPDNGRATLYEAGEEVPWGTGQIGALIAFARELERLQGDFAHLQFSLNSRDEYLGKIGQWQAYLDTLPERKAGVPGGWSGT